MTEVSFNDMKLFMERLVLLEKIKKEIGQAERGEMISLEDLKEEMKSW